ncbi:hypothetical protein K439DRAFT_1331467 [Ramaria rubella]|nr:hypothetical protein K439DRAFT_1331467 [Ramaria rubella]
MVNGNVPSAENIAGRDARHLLKHIFPRQFGLKNPFEDRRHPSISGDVIDKDEEIKMRGNVKTPKRLKPVLSIIEQLIKKHWICNYRGIRSMVCPSKVPMTLLM